MGLCSSVQPLISMQYGDQEKVDILHKLDEDPSYQGPGTDQVETWTELNITGPECRLPDSILRCANLKMLDISNNIYMKEESIVTIFSLEALEDLDMSNCSITFIPPEISMPKHLRKLNLSNNQLSEIPLRLCSIVTLGELDLKNNNIKNITPDLKRLYKLTKIDISRNPLEEFPTTILEMKALESINLDSANITTIPQQVKQLTNLSELNLSNNRLEKLPKALFELETLVNLDLSKTDIVSVPSQIKELTNLKGLNLSWNKLKKFPMSVCELVTLETLDLSQTTITTVPHQIRKLTNLKLLRLSENRLNEFPMPVCDLMTLETLEIYKNNITSVPPEIAQLKNLKKLELCSNNFTEFPLTVCDLVTLETLQLHKNHITKVPPQVDQLKNLKKLELCSNNLKKIPLTVCKLVTLEILDLAETNITTVPPQIRQLNNLKELNLSLNKLSELPMPVCGLVTLETLDLSENNITTVPPQITQLTNLKELNLSLNKLTEFPKPVCELVTLETLDLFTSRITRVPPDLKRLKKLKKLDLSRSNLKKFPMSVCELVNLESLGISDNSIKKVPHQITKLKNLKELKLHGNQLDEFPIPVCEMVTLETINLQYNKIRHVPSQIKRLQHLRNINLANNMIHTLSFDICFLSKLETFNLRWNYLQQPPQEVADRGIEAIKRYIDDLVKTEATSSFRLQVQAIGETCAGKTSLIKTLTSGSPFLTSMADRTHVMEQIRWSPKENVFLSINDFGGHDVYKVAHNFFITKEALTLIVFNFQNVSMNYQEAVGSWIDNVYSRAPDSAILLVGTHADCLSSEAVDKIKRELLCVLNSHLSNMASNFRTRLEELEKKSKVIKSGELTYKAKMSRIARLMQTLPRVDKRVFAISSQSGYGIAELKDELIRKARENKYILPESWLQKMEHIETAKRNKQDPFLTLKSLANMAELTQRHGGDDAQRVEDVLSFLHATGVVLWFREKPMLKNFIFHRQDVFIDILKAVLHHDIGSVLVFDRDPFNKKFSKEKFESAKRDVLQRGIISRTMLECLWRRFDFGKQGHDAMLELLENFEICYVADEDRYHFPWLLKEDRPEDISSSWSIVPTRDESQVTTEVHFPVTCPTGLYEMAAVHLHGYLGQFKASRRDWKDGFYAKLDNQCRIFCEREVPGISPNGVIRLSIRGNDPIQVKKYSLNIFQDLLSLAEKECPGSPRDEFLVCPHCVHEDNTPPTLFDTPVSLLRVPLEVPVPYHPCPEEEPEFMASADFYYPVTAGKMTDLHYTSLEKHLVQVVDDVRGSRHEILRRLAKADVITEKEKKASLVLGEEDRLIGFLRRKNDSAFYIFCGALHDSGHVETVQLLRLPDLAMMLPKDNFKALLQRLRSKDVMSQGDIDTVMSKTTQQLRVSALVKTLRENKNSHEAGRAFDEFQDALYDEIRRLKECTRCDAFKKTD